MTTTTTTPEKSDSRTPDFKAPPKSDRDAAKVERNRRRACHGDWTPCANHTS